MKNFFLLAVAMSLGAVARAAPDAALVLEKSIPLPGVSDGFNHHSADGAHRRVFVCASGNKSVEVVDLKSGQIIKSLPGDRPAATCFASGLNLLCVSRGNRVQIYDTESFRLLSTLSLPCSIDELRFDPRTKQLLAGGMTPPNEGIAVIDLTRRKIATELKSPHPQGFCVEEEGSRIFVSTPRTAEVTALDRRRGAIVADWKLTEAAGNYPIDFDPATRRLFVGCRRPAALVVLDSATGTEVARTKIGEDTDDLSFDRANKRIYVACGEGVVAVVQQDDANHYRTVQRIATAPDARNGVFLPETGEFCVTAPRHDNQPPQLLVYRALARQR